MVVSSGNPHCHCHCQFNTRVDSMAINPIRSKQKESVDFCDCFCCCWEREDRFLCKIWVVSCSMQSYLSPASAVLPPKVETLVVVKENSLVSLFFSACDTISYKSRDECFLPPSREPSTVRVFAQQRKLCHTHSDSGTTQDAF